MLVCAFPVHHCTRDRGCSAHPVFPAPIVFRAELICKTSDKTMSREREGVFGFVARMSEAISGMTAIPHVASLMRATKVSRHCERSEAIQGHTWSTGLLRRFAPRNDDEANSRVLATASARGLQNRSPPKKRAQGRPGARCTRGLVCIDAQGNAHTSIQVKRKHSGLPCAMALRLIRALPGDRAFLPPSPLRSLDRKSVV